MAKQPLAPKPVSFYPPHNSQNVLALQLTSSTTQHGDGRDATTVKSTYLSLVIGFDVPVLSGKGTLVIDDLGWGSTPKSTPVAFSASHEHNLL